MPTLTRRQKTARFHAALGHQRRIKILEVLNDHTKGLTYEHLSVAARIPEGSLCHHLRVLSQADLVLRKVRGRHTYYKLGPTALYAPPHPIAQIQDHSAPPSALHA